MTPEKLLLLVAVILAVLFLIFYTIVMANRWINKKQEIVDELSYDLPETLRNFRNELKNFNNKLKSDYIPQPFSTHELGAFLGSLIGDIVKSRLPGFGFGKNLLFLTVLYKLWKNRSRLRATFT